MSNYGRFIDSRHRITDIRGFLISIISQNTVKNGLFHTSGQNSGEKESEFYYKLCKTKPILKQNTENRIQKTEYRRQQNHGKR